MQIILLNGTGGIAINSLAVGSGQTVTTEGLDTSKVKNSGLLLVFTGTVNALTRDVSIDDINYYTPYDSKMGILNACITGSVNNSRFITLEINNSANMVVPWTRYNIKMLSGGTLTAYYIADEDLA